MDEELNQKRSYGAEACNDNSDSDYSQETTDCDKRKHTSMMEEANRAYASLVNTFNGSLDDSSMLLSESGEISQRYRGLLLGRSSEDGASVEELLTARLQHDVNFCEVLFQLDTRIKQTKPSPVLRNKEIVQELCKTVALLLKRYSSDDRAKFAQGTQEVIPGVVSALFNVSRRNNIRMSDVGISYTTRVKMIKQCLEVAETMTNKKVTIAIAKAAHLKFVVDPNGEQSPVVNLGVVTNAFAEHIKSIMKKGYLDVTLGLHKSKNLPLFKESEKDRLPSVTIHRVNSKDESFTKPFTVMVVHNFVSPLFMNKWIKRMNELPFTRGKGGKSNAFIRNCSTTMEPAPILIGAKLVYGGGGS